MNTAEDSAADYLYDLATNRGELPIVDREHDAFLFHRQLADLIELLPCEHQRLLAQDVPSTLERKNGNFKMCVRRRTNVDEIQVLRQIRN